ncbi:AraC family transcriptional regulator [Bacillus sp. JCM 19034]|uniref:AraC family transcriptional regulator n=1 Tax=Bacillus sp. JCM 19034 TaxID=1481928 RepID=UPI0007856BDD|nr:AraC family transcriptional regulator [Bacillus sp. JCM 19034]
MPNRLYNWSKQIWKITQTRLVLLVSLAIFIIILIVGFTSYYSSKSVLQEQLHEPQKQMLHISMELIDSYIEETNKTAINLSLEPSIHEFLKSTHQNSYDNITGIYQLLSTVIKNSPYIKSIYIYDVNKDSFVSMPQGYSSNRINFIDSHWIDDLNEFELETMVVKKREVRKSENSTISEITLFRKIKINDSLMGIIAINLEEDEIFSKLNPSDSSAINSMWFITDKHNEVLFTKPPNHAFGFVPIDEILQELDENEISEFLYEDQKLLGTMMTSQLTSWNYVSLVSQDSLLAKSKTIRNVVFLVSLIALSLGLMVIIYIHNQLFKPIRRIKKLFNVKDNNMEMGDLTHLENLAVDLISDHTYLSRMVQKVKMEATSKFFNDIYLGNIKNKKAVYEKWTLYYQEWTNKPYVIVMISIDSYYEWVKKYPEPDHPLLKFALTNIVSEVLTPVGRCECADLGKDKLALLLYGESELGNLSTCLLKAVTSVGELLGFSISIGVSRVGSDIGELEHFMIEARDVLTIRAYKGYGSFITYDEFKSYTNNHSQLNEDKIENLIELIQSGNTSSASNLITSLISEITKNKYNPIKVIPFLGKIEKRLQHLSISNIEENEQQIMERFLTMDLQDIEKRLQSQATTLSERFKVTQQQKEYIICTQMIEFMKCHLKEPIGVQEIADSVQISVSLASQIFKEQMNETIYGYFTRLRIEHAIELLLETDKKISDIAIEVGYQHENSFIRVFRKYKNITPGKYRGQLKYGTDK